MIKVDRKIDRHTSNCWRGVLFASLIVLAGCATGPPVQEMSDARQAIAVARQAGAAQLAPDALHAAETFLDSAQQKLSRSAYAQARSDAIQAKNLAIEALASSENSDQNEPR
jgi:hypothetical protein